MAKAVKDQPLQNSKVPRKATNAEKKPTRRERRLILTKPHGKNFTQFQALNIRNTINKAYGQTIVQLVSMSKAENLVLTTMEDFTADDLLKDEAKLRNLIEYHEAKIDTIWSQVVIHGVRIRGITLFEMADLNSPQGLQAIEEDIKVFNKHLNLELVDHIRWLTPKEKRDDPGTVKVSVVMALKTPEQAKKAIKQGLCIFGSKTRLEALHSAAPNTQCNKCQRFGHIAEYCKQDTRCRICDENHNTREHFCKECQAYGKKCSHTDISCANCKNPHCADDKACQAKPIPPSRNL
jgi:hypothetical protein